MATRVLIVDDSAFMRHSVSRAISAQADMEVAGMAADGIEALEQVRRLHPDVITLDVEMPRMDGLRTLEVLMRDHPLPVVMLSSLTGAGAPATIHALELGAVDFVQKPAPPVIGVARAQAELIEKVRLAARVRVHRRGSAAEPAKGAPEQTTPERPRGAIGSRLAAAAPAVVRPVPPALKVAPRTGVRADRVLAIGSSTGGPRALIEVIPHLPGNLPATVLVVQHMPAGFTRSLAERLDQASALTVREAEAGDVPAPGLVLLAPGGRHMELDAAGRVVLTDDPAVHGVRPSVDVLLRSLPAVFGRRIVTAILTGMGSDGAEGCAVVRAAGGRVIAEAESTCAVYGMPRAVVDRGLAERQAPLGDVAGLLTDFILQDRPATGATRAAG